MRWKILFLMLIVFSQSVLVFAQVPSLSSYVTDNANVLSPEFQSDLENALRALEQETNGVQFVVFIEKAILEESTLEERTLQIAEQNGIGKEENDNGILFYLATDDREYRWETGYGIEGTLSSSWLGRMSRETLNPAFSEGNYEKGILDAVSQIGQRLLESSDADIVKIEDSSRVTMEKGMIIAAIIIAIIVFILFMILSAKQKGVRKKSYRDGVYTGAASGIFLPPWRGSGGFGGGFGGFSGGGGGFGGGGFSGRF